MPLWLSDQAQDFLSKTLLKDPTKRSTAVQLLKHPWLKSLGFKQPADAVPSSIEVLEPVLPPRPVVQSLPEPVVMAEPNAAEEEAVEAVTEEAVAVPQRVAVTATGGFISSSDAVKVWKLWVWDLCVNAPQLSLCLLHCTLKCVICNDIAAFDNALMSDVHMLSI